MLIKTAGARDRIALAPAILSILLVATVTAITLTHVGISLAAVGRRTRAARAGHVPDEQPPSYTILIRAYEERDVIGGRVDCLRRLDYPRDRLEALILVERRDHATQAAIRAAVAAP